MNATAAQARKELPKRQPRGYIEVEVSEHVRVELEEVLEDLTDDQLQGEMERRGKSPANVELLLVYEEFVRRGDAPQCLRDYIYDHLGRVL